jgi:Fe-S cluster biogenesis protein NfuA
MTTATTWDRIEAVIEEIRPAVRADGGDVELVSFDAEAGVVELRLAGACHTCPYSLLTLKSGIEHRLRTQLPEVKSVVAK